MKTKTLAILLLLLVGCSTAVKKTKESDKTLRVMLDPDSIDAQNHAILQNELQSSGKFYIVDRSRAFAALKREQELEHKKDHGRFEDKQRYAHWGKLYGVGGVVIAHLQCSENPSTENVLYGVFHLATLGVFHNRRICTQILELADTNTGEIIVSVRNDFKTDSESYQINWEDITNKLITQYPKYFEIIKKHSYLVEYEKESELNSQETRKVSNESP